MFKYKRQSDIFHIINTEEKAYWLGFLYADGYINIEKNFVHLGLKQEDYEHLKKFQQFLQTDIPISVFKNNGNHSCASIRIHDKQIVTDLQNQGLYPKKSLTLIPNFKMDDNLIIHWIRGVFDGDGSIFPQKNSRHSIKYRLNLCGTKDMLLYIENQLHINRPLDYNRSIPKFVVCAKMEVNRILHLLYDNATIFLTRKQQLAQIAIKTNLQ